MTEIDMACLDWAGKLDAYLDGELEVAEARAVSEHLRGCASCAAESLSRVQQKRALHGAGQRFVPDPAFRARIQKSIAPRKSREWNRLWFPALAGAMVLVIVGALFLTFNREKRDDARLLSELADMHVATLASSNPVDVVSTDRHTVKPWFAGKIPFTFTLPELQDTAFSLVGGKVSYLNQSPGAELIFRVRQHQISVFIFQERAAGRVHALDASTDASSFNVRSWRRNGLVYFAISDVGGQDLETLSELMKGAG
jgi:anti-sigma factor RsiW